jgi:hypothetical protein
MPLSRVLCDKVGCRNNDSGICYSNAMPIFVTPDFIFDEQGVLVPNSDEVMECKTFERRQTDQQR